MMTIGYVVYGVIGFIIGACICYSLMVVTHDHLKERLKDMEEHLNHNQLLELEQAVSKAETEEQIRNLLMFHELAFDSEQKFLIHVGTLRLRYLAERDDSRENTRPGSDDTTGGSG